MIELSVALAASSPLQAWILRSQKEIAARLGNARRTVSRHGPAPVAVGMVKLGLDRGAAANRLAIDNALSV
jgi:hypothetical protein